MGHTSSDYAKPTRSADRLIKVAIVAFRKIIVIAQLAILAKVCELKQSCQDSRQQGQHETQPPQASLLAARSPFAPTDTLGLERHEGSPALLRRIVKHKTPHATKRLNEFSGGPVAALGQWRDKQRARKSSSAVGHPYQA